MSNTLIIIIIISVLMILIAFYGIKKYKNSKKNKPKKEKKVKVKVKKDKKVKKNKKPEKSFNDIGSYVDINTKYLFRKELKLLILINKILPKGFIVFPKVGVDLILTPVGNKSLYESIHGEYLDLVIFEEDTMKPRIAIDLYDGSIGDEQLDIHHPNVLKALDSAELPIISFKVKTEYTEEEIKEPIFKILNKNDEKQK